MTPQSPAQPRTARRYGFACVQCRQKKVKCGGEQPSCRKCQRSGETCRYPQRATDSSLASAQSRIIELEGALANAKQTVSPSAFSAAPPTDHNGVRTGGDSSEQDDLSPHVGLDENGGVTYHGPTSRFYAASIEEPLAATPSRVSFQLSSRDNNTDLLHRVWEPFLESKTESELGARPALVQKLLNIYWTWQHPLHHYVYKPCFIMDMALGGPYYSKFLLHAICSLAARHLEPYTPEHAESDKGEKFLKTARELLVHEFAAPKPRIPTIQGLLILGGRQCAVGRSSEGWLYTGMAIRMMTDLGLHLNLHRLAELENLTAVDLELRKRLYCSAYVWDKSLSLSLGRPPTLTKPPSHLDTLDQSDEEDIWLPEEHPNYPPTRAHTTICLQYFCRLSEVIELIMRPAHDRVSHSALCERISTLQQKLANWHQELPETLRMGDDCPVCPPPHILSLNLLYQTLHIILWRPYLHLEQMGSRAWAVCTTKAEIVHRMFLLYGESFQWKKMTYLISYCVYTAATVDVEGMKSADKESREAAAKRLAVSLKILESETKQTPGIRRSIDIIKRQLRTWTTNTAQQITSRDMNTIFSSVPQALSHGQNTFQNQQHTENADDAGTIPVMHRQSEQYQPQFSDFQRLLGMNPSLEYGDTGGGFHPDAFPWPNTWGMDPEFFDTRPTGTSNWFQ